MIFDDVCSCIYCACASRSNQLWFRFIPDTCTCTMSDSRSVTVEDWTKAWETDHIPWHKDSVSKYLINNIEELTNGKPNLRILVPFCGKTLDMIWLVKQGHTVIGVEVVQKAIQDFFSENDIPFEKEIINMAPNGANVYTAFNGKLKIFDCDYFSFNSSVAGGKVDGIWDCNAFGAIPPERRKEYMKTSLNLLQRSPNGCILYKAYVYETDGTFTGPPHSIPLDVLRALFDDSFEVRAVCRETQPEELRLRFGVSSLDVLVTSIKYKS